MNLDNLGGRKLIGGILVIAVGLVVTLLKGDVPHAFGELLEVVFGAFVIGNAAEHGAAVLKSRGAEVTLSAPPQDELAHQKLDEVAKGVGLTQELLQLAIQRLGIK